jgi:hypothetical protein
MYMNTMQNAANTVPQMGNAFMQTAMSLRPTTQYIPGTPDSNPMATTLGQFSGGLSGLKFGGGGTTSPFSGIGSMYSGADPAFSQQTNSYGANPMASTISGVDPAYNQTGVGFGVYNSQRSKYLP